MRLAPLLLFLSALSSGWSARILAVFPFPGRSHFVFFHSIINVLTERGHTVVEYSPYPPSTPFPNYSHIEIHSEFEKFKDKWSFDVFRKITATTTTFTTFKSIHDLVYPVCEDTFKDIKIQKLLKLDDHFDLVLTESTFGQPSMLVFGHKFNAPVISLNTNAALVSIKMDAGNSLAMAYNPNLLALVATDQMSFTERLFNFVSITTRLAHYYLVELPQHDSLVRRYYREDAPPVQEMVTNISLYFINSHPAVEYVQPYTPNIIPVAGININPDRKPLPQDLKKFMDEGKDGVIYFSLGSVVPAHTFPEDIIQIFVKVFSRLKQKVLWKIEVDSLPGLSKNVKLSKWLPQTEVLAHPNCVLFITHGGLFSQYEALEAGVPTLGIPFFADQPYNIKFSEHRGYGLKLDFLTLSEDSLTTALNTILQDSTYREIAKRLSRVFRDRPVSPADSVVFWTEYVLRHAGAHHLRPASTRLSWYQLALLDVLAAILLSVMLVLVLFYFVTRRILQIIFKKKKNKSVPAKKKDS